MRAVNGGRPNPRETSTPPLPVTSTSLGASPALYGRGRRCSAGPARRLSVLGRRASARGGETRRNGEDPSGKDCANRPERIALSCVARRAYLKGSRLLHGGPVPNALRTESGGF